MISRKGRPSEFVTRQLFIEYLFKNILDFYHSSKSRKQLGRTIIVLGHTMLLIIIAIEKSFRSINKYFLIYIFCIAFHATPFEGKIEKLAVQPINLSSIALIVEIDRSLLTGQRYFYIQEYINHASFCPIEDQSRL